MNIVLLKKALESYVLSAELTEADRAEAFCALSECSEAIERYTDYDVFKYSSTLIHDNALSDVLNMLTYDTYGKLARLHGPDNVTFEMYADKCRVDTFRSFTNQQLELGYYFIRDLWSDNEACDDNDQDGTFKHIAI